MGISRKGSVRFVGFGEAPPEPSEMVGNERVLEILRSRGVDTKGKSGEDTEKLVGIRTRWWSRHSSTELATIAARRAVDDAAARTGGAFAVDRLDLVHSGGSSPDNVFPACACEVQGALGVPANRAEARDVSLACTSWLDALVLADARMRHKGFRYGLVTTGESVGSRMNAPTSLSFTLWGDAGAAVVLEHDPEGDPSFGLIADASHADGEHADWTKSIGLGLHPSHAAWDHPDCSMLDHGRDIHKYAIREVSSAITRLIARERLNGEPFWLVPHNANLGLVTRIGELAGVPEDRVLTRVRDRGNTSSASVGINLVEHARSGTFRPGDLLVLAAFGGGMAMTLAAYRWPPAGDGD
ncbi:MAG TPA: 3-oxoacyl-[acyl-carrier-protein] synthase III C-terminal domain-containing protein [Candidatus Polarisedimenticolaceae bacterium]